MPWLARHQARQTHMDALVPIHTESLAPARLVATGATFAWIWNPAKSPVEPSSALSALNVLTGADLSRIKRCG